MKKFIFSSLLIHIGAGTLLYIYSGSQWKSELNDVLSNLRTAVSEDLMESPSSHEGTLRKPRVLPKKEFKKKNTKKSIKRVPKTSSKVIPKKPKLVKKNEAPQKDQDDSTIKAKAPELQAQQNDLPVLEVSEPELESISEDVELSKKDEKIVDFENSYSEMDLPNDIPVINTPSIEPEWNSKADSLHAAQDEAPQLDFSNDSFLDDEEDLLVEEESSTFQKAVISKEVGDDLLQESIKNQELSELKNEQIYLEDEDLQDEQIAQKEIEQVDLQDEDLQDEQIAQKDEEDILLNRRFEDINTDPKEIGSIIKSDSQEGSQKEEVQMSQTELQPLGGSPAIKYPERARLREKEGSVSLLYFINDDGLVNKVQMLKSSGDSDLDNEAVRILAKQQYPSGKAGWYSRKVDFKLKTM